MYSFDVFDTLITRRTASPQGIFSLMEVRLKAERAVNGLDDYIIDNFYELRIHSEDLARHSAAFKQREEISLYDIYTAMAASGYLDEEQIAYLCDLEQNIEVDNVIGIDKMIQQVKLFLKQGERVVLISDMYLPGDIVRRMLVRAEALFESIPLYVSSDYGVRKTTGNLYRKVQEIEQVNYDQWIHYGDNLRQDIEIPYQLGIKVRFLPQKEWTTLEKRLLKEYGDDDRLQLMIGAAIRAEKEDSEKAYHIGCRYAGPVLYRYAEWIVKRAVEKKIKRLYFIARDGYLIKKIVDIILIEKKYNVSTVYIYGSRKSWRMASLSENHYNLYQLVWWSHFKRIETLDELASVMHISLEGLYRYLPGTYAKHRENRYISCQELEYIVNRLSMDKEFVKYHLYELKTERALVQKYLIQEVDVSDDQFAFVDVSGGGLTQGCLRELLKERYGKPIHTFFFKIDMVNLVEDSVSEVFLPSFMENNLIMEMMCRAPHGQTSGYREENGRIIPDLEMEEGNLLKKHGFAEYEKGIVDFSLLMCRMSADSDIETCTIRTILLYMEHIAKEPPSDVLEYFASMPSSETGRCREDIEYAPRLTQQDIKNIFWLRTSEPIELYYKGTNLNYSILRASEEEKKLIEQYKKERSSIVGKLYQQEKERKQKELYSQYGRAAFYPARLLEERIVLYGAGNFGRDLYYRLMEDREHEIVLWVDRKADYYIQQGLADVHNVSEIENVSYDQIVIAVISRDMADAIRRELVLQGVENDKIIWIQPFQDPNVQIKWQADKI